MVYLRTKLGYGTNYYFIFWGITTLKMYANIKKFKLVILKFCLQ